MTLRDAILAWLFLLGILVISARCAAQGEKYSREYSDADVHMCARAAVGEVGWDHPMAWIAMTAVHVRRAERMGVSLERACFLYSSALRRPRRRWVPLLGPGMRAPRGWPESLVWGWRRDRFMLVAELIRWYLEGLWPDPCGADHYGGPLYLDAHPEGWILLHCADAPRRKNQRFYQLPK